MYIPRAFEVADVREALAFMRRYNFVTVVTHGPDGIAASHVPVIVRDGAVAVPTLHAHLALANPQWQHFDGTQEVLAIFQGPHGYVSPSLYETHPSVPTWNYQVVHAYGLPAVIEDPAAAREHVLALVAQEEAGSPSPWAPNLPEAYLEGMLRQIVAFRIDVTRIEAKYKLSQNRGRVDRENVAVAFETSHDPTLRALGDATRRTLT